MRLSLLCLVLVVVGCSRTQVQECEPLVPGVSVVVAASSGTVDSVSADGWTELWRVGGQREGQELAIPVSAAVSPTGVLAVPDFRLQEVILIGPDGTWLGPRFRRGPGPEELTYPVAATWSSAGALSVFDLGTPKVITANSAGSVETIPVPLAFVASVVASGELLWAGVQPAGTLFLYPGWQRIEVDGAPFLQGVILRLQPGASTPDTILKRTFPGLPKGRFSTMPAPGWAHPVAAVGQNGRVAVGGFDESYRILLYDSTGTPDRQICGLGSPIAMTGPERGELGGDAIEGLEAAIREAAQPPEPARYGRLLISADGLLWVQRERPAPVSTAGVLYGAPGALYDVFDSTGRYRHSARLPEHAYLLEALGDTIWTFEIGEYDEVEVVAYARTRSS